jgi:hypothetical protein
MNRSRFAAIWLLGSAAIALVGCNQTSAPGSAAASAPGVTPSSFRLPDGTGCAGEVARFQAVIDNDVQIGHVNQSVYNRMSSDLSRASAACSAGRDAEAAGQLRTTKARYGYP